MNKLNHIAFIMDGNGRWGKKKGKSRNFGHKSGADVVKNIVKLGLKIKIPILTFYVFSAENWKRPKNEINFLFGLISNYFNSEIDNVVKNGIKLNIIGQQNKLPVKLKNILNNVILKTKKNKKIIINLAINYGSKHEILNAVQKIKNSKKININKINSNLYTSGQPDPEILIRTGGKKRLSNFLLWQLAYTELFFLDKLWPEFNEIDLKKIIKKYHQIKRNFGNI